MRFRETRFGPSSLRLRRATPRRLQIWRADATRAPGRCANWRLAGHCAHWRPKGRPASRRLPGHHDLRLPCRCQPLLCLSCHLWRCLHCLGVARLILDRRGACPCYESRPCCLHCGYCVACTGLLVLGVRSCSREVASQGDVRLGRSPCQAFSCALGQEAVLRFRSVAQREGPRAPRAPALRRPRAAGACRARPGSR